MRLHVRTARANTSTHDPYTNLLRATTEAMSAAIGGADTMLVEPHGYDAHLAINVQRILAEEAHLDAVADPAGGSYYIEAITDALAREAWTQFQALEAARGRGALSRPDFSTMAYGLRATGYGLPEASGSLQAEGRRP